jgi:hypothetical protein
MRRKMNQKITKLIVLATMFMNSLAFSIDQGQPKIHPDYPILSDREYFEYRGLNSRNVTLRTLLSFDCPLLLQIYYRDPQLAVDNVSLVILVQKALEGADVAIMPEQERINHAIVEIVQKLKKFGRIQEAKDYLGQNCQCKSKIPNARALCQILEEKIWEILYEKYHYRNIFPDPS